MDHPALDRLGYSLNLLSLTPFDIGTVEKNVLGGRRLLSINPNGARSVPIHGKSYSIPGGVSIADDAQITEGQYISFPDGRDAASAFAADVSYPLRYFAVSGTTSAILAAQKSFLHRHQYSFFSYTEAAYSVRLKDYASSLDEKHLAVALDGIPRPFDSSKPDDVTKYKQFFNDFGTHVIHNCNYGARYPLKVWGSNENQQVNEMFNTDVKVKFNGIPSGGDHDSTIKDTEQYKRFSEYFQYLLTISGGASGDRSTLVNTDATYNDYTKWRKSIKDTEPSLLSFQAAEIWTLMKFSESDVLRNYAGPLQDAFMWIVGHPVVYKTAVSLDIQTDWAAFNLLTPSAIIIPDPDHPYPKDYTVASDTRVQWGNEYSHNYERRTLRFFVINDGSSIAFSISHGSQGGGGALSGTAIVTVEEKSFTNHRINDNVWNTEWYYKVPVNRTPETKTNFSKPFLDWNDVLKEYLAQLGK